ncbi:MAG: competence/damage-inducible protein A [Solirubrobacterales bacterium]
MNAEIISVGTELLLGDIVNTNAQYLARRLADYGIPVFHQSVVGDNSKRLKDEFSEAFKRCNIIITTGGLGPTSDDITKEIAAEYFNKEMIIDQGSLNKLEEIFLKQNRTLTLSNKKQAYFPKGCIILPNHNGTAPGCIINENDKILVVLPGPPREVQPMFENYVIPYIEKLTDNIIISKVLRVSGLGESYMAEMVQDIIDQSTNPTVAPYAKSGESILRITAKGKSEEECIKLISPIEDKIRERLGDNLYGTGETSLEEVIYNNLIKKNLTISTAESCTGGLVAGTLVNFPGISKVFMEGAVTYSNEAKINRLGVNPNTLIQFGAVSPETAMEMAAGIAKTSGTSIAVSTTGIAGPEGGTEDKPVGLVYIGLYINGNVSFKKLNIFGNRTAVRARAVVAALDFLRRELIKI